MKMQKGAGGKTQHFIQHEIKTRASIEQRPRRIEVAAELKFNAIPMLVQLSLSFGAEMSVAFRFWNSIILATVSGAEVGPPPSK